MKKIQAATLFLALSMPLAALADDEKRVVSVVPGGLAKPVPAVSQNPIGNPAAKAGESSPAAAKSTTPKTPAAAPAGANAAAATDGQASESPVGDTVPPSPVAKSYYSPALEQAYRGYKAAPSDATYSQLLGALRSVLAAAGGSRLTPAILSKDNSYLAELKPRVIEANSVRLWSFAKAPERSHLLLQWFDKKSEVVGAGRHKRVVSSVAMRIQDFNLPGQLNVKDATVLTLKDGSKNLVLSGDNEDGSLGVAAYKMTDAGWQANTTFLSALPAFLLNNVSGRLNFRGNDLIFTVGRMFQTTDASGAKRWMPEAESATYRFLVKQTDAGFVLSALLPNEDAFSVVHDFMQAVQQGRTDLQRALLVDQHLVSIPKYLGLQGKTLDASARVVEMSMPPGRGQRFRIISMGKDDLIFDVGKAKGALQIKAIFIAQPEPFLQEVAKNFPLYSHFDQLALEKKEAAETAAATAAAGTASKTIKRK